MPAPSPSSAPSSAPAPALLPALFPLRLLLVLLLLLLAPRGALAQIAVPQGIVTPIWQCPTGADIVPGKDTSYQTFCKQVRRDGAGSRARAARAARASAAERRKRASQASVAVERRKSVNIVASVTPASAPASSALASSRASHVPPLTLACERRARRSSPCAWRTRR